MKKHNKRIDIDEHEYQLVVDVSAEGDEILSSWSAELTFPQSMLLPNHNYPVVRSDQEGRLAIMRVTETMMGGPLYPGERKKLFDITYRMTHDLYSQRSRLFPTPVVATLYHGTKRIAREQMLVKDLQQF